MTQFLSMLMDNELIGLELNRYNPIPSDGKVRNEQLFDISQGRDWYC